ncbi:MAG: phospholipase D-like domain-containing protein [Anaerolineales bacterium]|nr:phospholipase D-like domain-containing protein [Anaerolineales bacterium]
MNRKIAALFLAVFLAACDAPQTTTPFAPVTQIPFFASDTPPPFIVPVTDTPQIIYPITETPTFEAPILIAETPLPPTAWWEVYFTDPLNMGNPNNLSGSIEEKLIELINSAQTSIHIASFEFNLPRVADALIAAKNRGVDVRWVTDDKNGLGIDANPNRGQFARLIAAGIQVKDDAGRSALMHNKFWIFDKQITWTGSTNITENGIYKQNNNVILIRSSEVAEIYEREWQELWTGLFGPRAPSTINNQWAILDGTPIQILFSAEDGAIANVNAVIRDAKSSVRFLIFSFTDDSMAQTMLARSQAGVDVQGVFETFGSASINSQLKTLWCANLPVRQDGNSSFLHHKVIVIDDSIVVTGSLNFSASADKSNEENVMIIDNPEIAALYLQEYQKMWNQSVGIPTGTFDCR